ncbi:hypothetical protein F8M41_000969 [Gigaspora margarita]|uniref:Uncharacterized protein n=1 Tax=Gigaspora margarita TaxID=4874 RepID=A0A8H3XGJ4_GIGMA|nr:hypothetical protein F8M41_000969 [Gigaspora margarita]
MNDQSVKEKSKDGNKPERSVLVIKADGTYGVGDFYRNGIVIVKGENETFVHCQKSTNLDHESGIRNQGYSHRDGTVKHEKKAFERNVKFAEMNGGGNIRAVSCCYENRTGDEKDEYHGEDVGSRMTMIFSVET